MLVETVVQLPATFFWRFTWTWVAVLFTPPRTIGKTSRNAPVPTLVPPSLVAIRLVWAASLY